MWLLAVHKTCWGNSWVKPVSYLSQPLPFTLRAPGVICFIHSRFCKAVPVKINTQKEVLRHCSEAREMGVWIKHKKWGSNAYNPHQNQGVLVACPYLQHSGGWDRGSPGKLYSYRSQNWWGLSSAGDPTSVNKVKYWGPAQALWSPEDCVWVPDVGHCTFYRVKCWVCFDLPVTVPLVSPVDIRNYWICLLLF